MNHFIFPKKDFKGYPEYAKAYKTEKNVVNSIQENINQILKIEGIVGLTSMERTQLNVCAEELIQVRDRMLKIIFEGKSLGEIINTLSKEK